jgi:cytochrome c oxidase subunit 3
MPSSQLAAMSASTLAPPPARRRRARRRADDLAPPDGGGGDGDRGDGGGDGDGDPARLGLALAILGMSTLFAAFLVAYLLLRRNAPTWPPPGAPLPPKGLWLSTLVILASSAAFVRAVRANEVAATRRWLGWTLSLGISFLAVQAILWREVFAGGRFTFSDAYGTIFYSLTGLHAAHVVGGLLFLARTILRARREPASPRTRLSLALCSTYWHFMGAIWIVLFCVLEFLN